MLVCEIFSYESGIRCTDKKQYSSMEEFEKELLLLKLSGKWVGHKIYDKMDMEYFNGLSQVARDTLKWTGSFDKESFINGTS